MLLDYIILIAVIIIIIRILFVTAFMIGAFVSTKVLIIYEKKGAGQTGYLSKRGYLTKKILCKIKKYIEGLLLYSSLIVGRMHSQKLRLFLYKKVFGLKIDRKVVIYNNLQIRHGYKIRIGRGSVIGDQCIFDGRNGLVIGDNVNISTGVWIWTEQHDKHSETFGTENAGGEVRIFNRAWISSRVNILPGVRIGEGSVIAANAVVTKDVEPFAIYAGIPAKKIGDRNKKIKYELDGEYLPFF